jgi:hypothetical protein
MNAKAIRKLCKRFGGKTIQVSMKYTREINQFIRKVEAAHRCTANSKLVF